MFAERREFHTANQEIDFGQFERLSMREAIVKYWPAAAGAAPTSAELGAAGRSARCGGALQRVTRGRMASDTARKRRKLSDGELTGELFEAVAEEHLIQPTFIYDFPTEISPLSNAEAG